jgi:hypothetical protein
MSGESTSSRAAAGRAPDNRFKDGVSDKQIAIRKIDVSSLQLDNSFDDVGDPYNNTGRHLKPAFKDR